MNTVREVKKLFRPQPTLEGAGVLLKRGFSYPEAQELDPFLLFDDFSSPEASDFMAGFPWHPHRGIETVTYILEGEIAHEDTLGNDGTIVAGDVQWMSAGSGIIHQEMPQVRPEGIKGFQLWVNLPSDRKMDKPRYQDVKANTIPTIIAGGAKVKVITGAHGEDTGPVSEVAGSPTYLDVSLEKDRTFEYPVLPGNTVLLFVIEGTILVGTNKTPVTKSIISLLTPGDTVRVEAAAGDPLASDVPHARFLLIAGTPLNEPIAWHGPIVMNTREELRVAMDDIARGTFIK